MRYYRKTWQFIAIELKANLNIEIMRTEIKIALGLYAANMVFGYLVSMPEFVKGMLLGLSIVFMIIGLLPESAYLKLKIRQARKLSHLKVLIGKN